MATSPTKIFLGLGCALVLSFAFMISTCAGFFSSVQPTAEAPSSGTWYARKSGVTVSSAGKVVRTLKYGEAINATCKAGACVMDADPKGATLSQGDLLGYMPRARVQYVIAPRAEARNDGDSQKTRSLPEGRKVEILEVNPGSTEAKTAAGWITLDQLGDKPLTAAEKSQARQAANAAASSEREARQAYAARLREKFLDGSMDIKVAVEGANADRLHLRFVLFNDVWVHNFQKGELEQEIRSMGFKKVDFDDGYNGYHVVVTFR